MNLLWHLTIVLQRYLSCSYEIHSISSESSQIKIVPENVLMMYSLFNTSITTHHLSLNASGFFQSQTQIAPNKSDYVPGYPNRGVTQSIPHQIIQKLITNKSICMTNWLIIANAIEISRRSSISQGQQWRNCFFNIRNVDM